MPPPGSLPELPFVIVRPDMVTVLPEATWNTRLLAFPFTARLLAPGPEMVMLLFTSSSPLVRPIVSVTAKVIVSPLLASASAWRNEPAPLSFVFVTVMTSPRSVMTTARDRAMKIAALILGVILILILVFGRLQRAAQIRR